MHGRIGQIYFNSNEILSDFQNQGEVYEIVPIDTFESNGLAQRCGNRTGGCLSSPSLTTTVLNDEKEVLLADGFSRTLYIFDLDTGSGTSKCNADCAEVWPPYILTAQEAASVQAPLGSVVRANKKLQLTYNGNPVYSYIFDRAKGDDHGDGIGDVWHYVQIK